MKNDRFLTVILVIIALLVVASLSLFFVRQDSATYLPEDTPAGVVHNYILAIEKGDYERAYDYLAEKQFKSSKETKPSFEEFKDNFLFNENNAGYQIGETVISDTTTISSKTAHVEITIMEGSSGIFFDRHYDYMEKARLIEEEGKWKITHMPYAYWGWDWYAEE